MSAVVAANKPYDFDPKKFLATIGEGRRVVLFSKKQAIFAQGDPADAVFYLQRGKVQLSVVSKVGKEATIGILNDGDLFWRGLSCRSDLAHGQCNSNDGLHGDED